MVDVSAVFVSRLATRGGPLMLLVSIALLSSFSALAEDCDAAALLKETQEASPLKGAELFVDLAACDAGVAKKAAADELARYLGGREGNGAMVAAITVGAPDAAIAWMDRIQSDEQAKAIAHLGEACAESEPIQAFFMERAETMGEDFWKQRWYRALATCPSQGVQGLLSAELDKGMGSDRSRFFAVLETFARGSADTAVPRLKSLLAEAADAEAESRIVAAFSDAAQVGSMKGVNGGAAAASVAAIVELAPELTTKGVEQARLTLRALGAEQASDELAAVRYKDARQSDGFHWGAVVVEDATCKNGKRMKRAHVADVVEPGNTWPDQLEEKVTAGAEISMELDLAAKCKGEGGVSTVVSAAPFGDAAAFKAWASETVDGLKAEEVDKFIKIDAEPIAF